MLNYQEFYFIFALSSINILLLHHITSLKLVLCYKDNLFCYLIPIEGQN